eukprot:c15191_g1_i1.p1 GENE.c15191_g1_i1~~c15191_g1_i1.p1  ORF type:complete len:249 (-),score=27.71 c15191_g1_i1:606-1265(-)
MGNDAAPAAAKDKTPASATAAAFAQLRARMNSDSCTFVKMSNYSEPAAASRDLLALFQRPDLATVKVVSVSSEYLIDGRQSGMHFLELGSKDDEARLQALVTKQPLFFRGRRVGLNPATTISAKYRTALSLVNFGERVGRSLVLSGVPAALGLSERVLSQFNRFELDVSKSFFALHQRSDTPAFVVTFVSEGEAHRAYRELNGKVVDVGFTIHLEYIPI